jgi:hypothetical protein
MLPHAAAMQAPAGADVGELNCGDRRRDKADLAASAFTWGVMTPGRSAGPSE